LVLGKRSLSYSPLIKEDLGDFIFGFETIS
jgi:hypothetical protein